MSTTVVKDRSAFLKQMTKLLTKQAVFVGIPESADARDDGPIGNATIGYLNETGSPSQNIPARPHLAPGIEEGKAAIIRQMERAGKSAMGGNASGISAGLNGAGLAGQNAVRNKITTGPFTPLGPKTISARKRRGRTGTKPLIDTGEYRRSITYVIRGPGDASS